jgi:hypothetical protein
MICQPIIIDGPARRKKMTVEGNQFVVIKQPRFNVTDYFSNTDLLSSTVPAFEQVLYHVHKFRVGEFTFAIASVNPKPPSLEKALKLIFTASARQAVIR